MRGGGGTAAARHRVTAGGGEGSSTWLARRVGLGGARGGSLR